MVHGLRTLNALNDAASQRRNSPAFQLPESARGDAVADVRFVMTEFMDQAVYIDGKLSSAEDEDGPVSIADLANDLGGRAARITCVMLATDWDEESWPGRFEDLIPYIDKESM